MLRMIDEFRPLFDAKGIGLHAPDVVQTLSVDELKELVPQFDGWIIGDDPATRDVFVAGVNGNLKAAVKWGVGVDNVDVAAAKELGLPIVNTPGMFGAEVSDIAVSYVVALARETFSIDREVRKGGWIKPAGISLAGRTVGLVGFGDIGRNTAKRLLAADMKIIIYDPFYNEVEKLEKVSSSKWSVRIEEADFLVFTCALTKENYHMLDEWVLRRCKDNVRIVNVSRGPLIDEQALIKALESGKVHSVALDVFETEPLPVNSRLKNFDRNIFGSHNSSNTVDAVRRASEKAISLLFEFLKVH